MQERNEAGCRRRAEHEDGGIYGETGGLSVKPLLILGTAPPSLGDVLSWKGGLSSQLLHVCLSRSLGHTKAVPE